jgi:hypothetical protein
MLWKLPGLAFPKNNLGWIVKNYILSVHGPPPFIKNSKPFKV